MASSLDFIEYVISQTPGIGPMRYKKMFGEYMVYLKNKPIILVCDDVCYVKKHESVLGLLADAETGIPFPGAREHFILDIDNRDLSREVLVALEPHLKIPKPKMGKNKIGESKEY